MVIKNVNNNQDSLIIDQGNANRPWGVVVGPNLRIIQKFSNENPYTIVESSTGERVYVLGPVFDTEEEAKRFEEFFEELNGISLAEFLAPVFIAYEQYMAEQQASGETPTTNE